MTKTYCDLCEKENDRLLQIEVLDGEHPHCRSTMRKNIDICQYCLTMLRLNLKCDEEFDELRARIRR